MFISDNCSPVHRFCIYRVSRNMTLYSLLQIFQFHGPENIFSGSPPRCSRLSPSRFPTKLRKTCSMTAARTRRTYTSPFFLQTEIRRLQSHTHSKTLSLQEIFSAGKLCHIARTVRSRIFTSRPDSREFQPPPYNPAIFLSLLLSTDFRYVYASSRKASFPLRVFPPLTLCHGAASAPLIRQHPDHLVSSAAC